MGGLLTGDTSHLCLDRDLVYSNFYCDVSHYLLYTRYVRTQVLFVVSFFMPSCRASLNCFARTLFLLGAVSVNEEQLPLTGSVKIAHSRLE